MKATPGQVKKMEELGLKGMFDENTTVQEARSIIIDHQPKQTEVKRIVASQINKENFSTNSDWGD